VIQQILIEALPWLLPMGLLALGSGFFSSSEVALFYLDPRDRKDFQTGSRAQQIAARLLDKPDRLLTAVLFWNLVINVLYFAIASIVSLRITNHAELGEAAAVGFAFGALITLILLSELLPKSVAVIRTRSMASILAVPLAAAVRMTDPLLPFLQTVNLLSRRLLWPRFEPEPYLEVEDLERAVAMSTDDAQLLTQEHRVLQNTVALSDLRVSEVMRPRSHFLSYQVPVSLADLKGTTPPSGYVLITELGSDEVAASIALERLTIVPRERLDRYATPVEYVPWSATVGWAMEIMRLKNTPVVAVVNEYGETTGIVTLDDVLDLLFSENASRSERMLNTASIRQIGPQQWRATGITSIRRLARELNLELPDSRAETVGGVIQETLQRIPVAGESCRWGEFELSIIEIPEHGHPVVEIRHTLSAEETP
jgi:putative hemolysin